MFVGNNLPESRMTSEEVIFALECGDVVCYENTKRIVGYDDGVLSVFNNKTGECIPMSRLDVGQCFICVR